MIFSNATSEDESYIMPGRLLGALAITGNTYRREKSERLAHAVRTGAGKGFLHMHGMGVSEVVGIPFVLLLRFGIPIAFAVWVIIAIKRIVDGIKRVSSRLDVIEKFLMDKEA
jgi:hypothetical protein